MVNKPVACIRADAAVNIGTGHIMRCLTLANTLHDYGFEVFFICREVSGNLYDLIEENGFAVCRLPFIIDLAPDASCEECISSMGKIWSRDEAETENILVKYGRQVDWLIIDHYAFDERWESKVRPYVKKIMVIDDLANRQHNCDLLLDQNLYANESPRYQQLVPAHTKKMVGPRYSLLRAEFAIARETLRRREGSIRRILIFFGGSDPTNETAKALEAVKLLNNPGIVVDVIVGASNPFKEQISSICEQMLNCRYHCQINYMADLMAQADLAIGAGGSTTWERCCLGLPALVAILAANQYEATSAVAEYGAVINMGWAHKITSEAYVHVLNAIDNIRLLDMQEKALQLVDGKGRYRVADEMLSCMTR